MKINIKTLLIVFFTFIFIQLSAENLVNIEGRQYHRKHYETKKIFEETFHKGDTLYLSSSTTINIKLWDKNTVKVECIKTIDYANMNISEIGIGDIIIKSNKGYKIIRINVKFSNDKLPSHKEISYGINRYVNIYMPKLANVRIENRGNIECDLDTIGDNKVILKSYNGNITLRVDEKINGIYAITKGGNIKSFYKVNSTIDKKNARIVLNTKSGDINITKLDNYVNEKR